MSFIATINLPDGPNNPSDDQPKMEINNNSFIGWANVDHYGYNVNNGGKHQLVSIPLDRLTSPGTGALEWKYYTKPNLALTSIETFWQRPAKGVNGPDIQMTVNVPDGLAGSNAPYGTPLTGFTQTGGVTFLPGGLVMQYGKLSATSVGGFGKIQFPFTWAIGAFSITVTAFSNSPGDDANVNSGFPPTLTEFFYDTSGGTVPGIYWMAIGK